MGNVTFCDQYKNLHNFIIMRDKLKILLDLDMHNMCRNN